MQSLRPLEETRQRIVCGDQRRGIELRTGRNVFIAGNQQFFPQLILVKRTRLFHPFSQIDQKTPRGMVCLRITRSEVILHFRAVEQIVKLRIPDRSFPVEFPDQPFQRCNLTVRRLHRTEFPARIRMK